MCVLFWFNAIRRLVGGFCWFCLFGFLLWFFFFFFCGLILTNSSSNHALQCKTVCKCGDI